MLLIDLLCFLSILPSHPVCSSLHSPFDNVRSGVMGVPGVTCVDEFKFAQNISFSSITSDFKVWN